VEDDVDIRSTMIELLQDTGYHVTEVADGQAALDVLAQDRNFDLIVLDLMMPVMDGFEFRNRQIADSKISQIPVVVMSADGHVTQKMARTAVSEYVRKPLDIEPFLEAVSRNLRRDPA